MSNSDGFEPRRNGLCFVFSGSSFFNSGFNQPELDSSTGSFFLPIPIPLQKTPDCLRQHLLFFCASGHNGPAHMRQVRAQLMRPPRQGLRQQQRGRRLRSEASASIEGETRDTSGVEETAEKTVEWRRINCWEWRSVRGIGSARGLWQHLCSVLLLQPSRGIDVVSSK